MTSSDEVGPLQNKSTGLLLVGAWQRRADSSDEALGYIYIYIYIYIYT